LTQSLHEQRQIRDFKLLWQFPSKEEEQHTFRTTPREHWWIWPECPRHAQVNN